ncbi:hypothetical protein X962_5541 [Burkholderia pseudomallei MSHR7343]|nr:hypothetical protein X962_5541 [Burkholderia pseudomallei MSHR7343]
MPPYASSRCRETPTDKQEMALNLYNPNNQRHCSGVESMWSGRLEAGVPNA